MEKIGLVNFDVFFLSQMTLPNWLTFPLGSLTVTLTDFLFWIYSFLLMLVFLLQSQFIFFPTQHRMLLFIAESDYFRDDWDGLRDHLRVFP